MKTDNGLVDFAEDIPWVGITVYQISGPARREMCMYSCQTAKKVSKEHKEKVKKVQKKVDKNNLSEKSCRFTIVHSSRKPRRRSYSPFSRMRFGSSRR